MVNCITIFGTYKYEQRQLRNLNYFYINYAQQTVIN